MPTKSTAPKPLTQAQRKRNHAKYLLHRDYYLAYMKAKYQIKKEYYKERTRKQIARRKRLKLCLACGRPARVNKTNCEACHQKRWSKAKIAQMKNLELARSANEKIRLFLSKENKENKLDT